MNGQASNYTSAYEAPEAEVVSYDPVDLISDSGWTPPIIPPSNW